jgi:hypothetical protein
MTNNHPMHRLNRTCRIAPTFTVADWDLYAGCGAAANALNETLATCVNNRLPRCVTHSEMLRMMDRHADCGAADSEPLRFLDAVLDVVYAQED